MASTKGPANSSGLVTVTASSSQSPRVCRAWSIASASTSSTSLPISVSKIIFTGPVGWAQTDAAASSRMEKAFTYCGDLLLESLLGPAIWHRGHERCKDPLTPALSRREREGVPQPCCHEPAFDCRRIFAHKLPAVLPLLS